MIDIVSATTDIGLANTQTVKAANVLSVQLNQLQYALDLGIDLNYFLNEQYSFQNESFKSYLIQVLANNSINVASVIETVESLFSTYTFNIKTEDTNSGLIAR